LNGNDYGTDVSIGHYDALNGLLLKGDGQGHFAPLSILKSGIYIPGNGKGLVKMVGASNQYLLAASQNQDALKIFALNSPAKTLKLLPNDVYALITFTDGKTEKEEFYYGASFLSQSSRFLKLNEAMRTIKIVNQKGESRVLNL